jgi:hypothetical protein
MAVAKDFNYLRVFLKNTGQWKETRNVSRNKSKPNIRTCRKVCVRTPSVLVKRCVN